MSNKPRTDVDYTTSPVDAAGRKSNLSMFMVMLGFTFFSASMWVGQQLAAGLDWWGFVWALVLGGLILAAYTGALGWIGAESGLSLDMLARRSFGTKGSWLPSAMISFTQTGWFGVGLAMFAIPVAKELMGLEVTPDSMPWQGYLLVAVAGILMTASAYFGIKSLTIISYIAVPAVAILGTVAMIMAVQRGDTGLIEQFAKGTKDLGVIAGAGLVVGSFVSGGTATPNFTRFAKSGKVGSHRHGRGRLAVLELLRLAERAQLHPAARGHHPYPPLFHASREGGPGTRRGLERHSRGRGRRRGRQPRPLGLRFHQRHGRRRPLLGNRPATVFAQIIHIQPLIAWSLSQKGQRPMSILLTF